MRYDAFQNLPTPGARSTCGGCNSELIAKCGDINVWHWAHKSAECDSWYEPISEWHLAWQDYFKSKGADIEVWRGAHIADVVLDGKVIEIQKSPISSADIASREAFYGDMSWIFAAEWLGDDSSRLKPTKNPTIFQWLHPRKTLLSVQGTMWWHVGETAYKVRVWEGFEKVFVHFLDKRSAPVHLPGVQGSRGWNRFFTEADREAGLIPDCTLYEDLFELLQRDRRGEIESRPRKFDESSFAIGHFEWCPAQRGEECSNTTFERQCALSKVVRCVHPREVWVSVDDGPKECLDCAAHNADALRHSERDCEECQDRAEAVRLAVAI